MKNENLTNSDKALEYLLKHVEDFGETKYTRTGELNCVGRLSYGCVNMAVAMNVIKIMEGKEVKDVFNDKSTNKINMRVMTSSTKAGYIALDQPLPPDSKIDTGKAVLKLTPVKSPVVDWFVFKVDNPEFTVYEEMVGNFVQQVK